MRAFSVKKKLGIILMSKKDKIELYQRDADAGEQVSKLYANKENWLTVQSILRGFHDEAVKKMKQRRLSPEDLEWVNQRISFIGEVFDKFELIKNKGIQANNKLKEMKNG